MFGEPPAVVEAAPAPSTPSPDAGVLVRATERTFTLPSSSLNEQDLRDLHAILVLKAREAAERQVATLKRGEGQSDADFEKLVSYVRSLLELVTGVHGADGDWIGGSGTNVLDVRPLPLNLARIVFESAFYHRNQTGQGPLNSLTLTLDFRRSRVFDGLLGTGEDLNESRALVNGQDATWVMGVSAELKRFFDQRATKRDWLHSPQSYSVAALFGIPLSLYWVYRIDHWFGPSTPGMPEAVKVAIYVYIVLLIMFMFRVTFNVARRSFPKLEGPERQTRGSWFQRTWLGVLVVSLLSSLLYEGIKAIVKRTF